MTETVDLVRNSSRNPLVYVLKIVFFPPSRLVQIRSQNIFPILYRFEETFSVNCSSGLAGAVLLNTRITKYVSLSGADDAHQMVFGQGYRFCRPNILFVFGT